MLFSDRYHDVLMPGIILHPCGFESGDFLLYFVLLVTFNWFFVVFCVLVWIVSVGIFGLVVGVCGKRVF
jgi:hypothetical protein